MPSASTGAARRRARYPGRRNGCREAIVAQLQQWSDADAKVTPLKTLQGWIWDEEVAAGALTSHFFPGVVPGVRHWAAAGHALWVFSSGSVAAQQAWFGHSPVGDLRPLLAGYFDTANAGPKRESSSYARIAATIGAAGGGDRVPVGRYSRTGCRTRGRLADGRRAPPGEPCYAVGVGDHLAVASFAA